MTTTHTARYHRGTACPWGHIQSSRIVAPGIVHITTASHGGYRLDEPTYHAMPPHLRECSFTKDQWFEEDCSWCAVVLAFPHHFGPGMVEAARQTHERMYR